MISSASYTIFSATDFLPASMIEFMNFESTTLPNFGSGLISRFSALWRRDIDRSFFLLCVDLTARQASRADRGVDLAAAGLLPAFFDRPLHRVRVVRRH